MLRTRLLTATAAVALFAAPAAMAQEVPVQAQAETQAPETAATEAPAAEGTVIDVLRAEGEFTTLLAALDQAQLTETLQTRPAISIFAPTDAAFAALPEAERERLMDPANVNELRQVLLYHVIVADVSSSQIEGARGPVETAARTQVQLDGSGEGIKVDEATVIRADIDASNGAVFSIDRVLDPAASQAAMGDAEAVETPPADAEDAPVASPPTLPEDEAADVVTPDTPEPVDPGA